MADIKTHSLVQAVQITSKEGGEAKSDHHWTAKLPFFILFQPVVHTNFPPSLPYLYNVIKQ